MEKQTSRRPALTIYLPDQYHRVMIRRLVAACLLAGTSLSGELRPAVDALMRKYGIDKDS